MNKTNAIAEIKRTFTRYKTVSASENKWLRQVTPGKVFELYCLSKTLEELRHTYGYLITFNGSSIVFQASPGMIDRSRPYFSIMDQRRQTLFELFTDIEFTTLGNSSVQSPDLSEYHEIDILVVLAGANGRPSFDRIALGVECKSHAKFKKSIVKEVLGIRRELSLFTGNGSPSLLARFAPRPVNVVVAARPPSEYWLAFVDSTGLQYSKSPSTFGITFRHWQP